MRDLLQRPSAESLGRLLDRIKNYLHLQREISRLRIRSRREKNGDGSPLLLANTFFRARVRSSEDVITNITVSANSRARARQKLIQQGLEVEELIATRPWWLIEFGRPVKQVVVLQVTRQLAAFTAAGVPILEALRILARTVTDRRMIEALTTIGQDVEDGESLAEAARVHSDIFPSYYLAILEASQQSGELQSTFETLSDYLERDLAAGRAVKSALFYPALLLAMAFVAVSVISTYVLPRFVTFFDSLNTPLPVTTRILITASSFFGEFWWLGLLLFLIAISAFLIYRRTLEGRLQIDTMLLRVPVVGKLIQLVSLERFTRTLGSLSKAGIPIPDGLALAAGVMNNKAFEMAIRKVREGVIGGLGLSGPLAATAVFPEETIQILRVGEQTGRLTEQLTHAASYYAKELEYRLKNLTTILEPVILVLVGGGVGFVAVALVSAMYGIYSGSALN